jgi:hypothetical protein
LPGREYLISRASYSEYGGREGAAQVGGTF